MTASSFGFNRSMKHNGAIDDSPIQRRAKKGTLRCAARRAAQPGESLHRAFLRDQQWFDRGDQGGV